MKTTQTMYPRFQISTGGAGKLLVLDRELVEWVMYMSFPVCASTKSHRTGLLFSPSQGLLQSDEESRLQAFN